MRKVTVGGDIYVFKREDTSGLFHRWGSKVGDHGLVVTVAIVELPNGDVVELPPHAIKFVIGKDETGSVNA